MPFLRRMPPLPPPTRALVPLLLLLSALSHAAAPETPKWTDHKGATFRGEPVEILGPLAMFRTGAFSSRFLPLRVLSPEDCVRFHQAIAGRPPRANQWLDARGQASSEFIGRLLRSEQRQLRELNFRSLPEPELLILLFGGRRAPESATPHYLLDNLGPFISRVQRVYPGRVATIVWATPQANLNLKSLPQAHAWLVADPAKLGEMKAMSRLAPAQGFTMLLLTREGVPLFGHPANDVVEVMKFVDGVSNFLWQLNPANPQTLRDRAHYLRIVRPVEFAEQAAPPVLLANPLRVDGLRDRGAQQVDARLGVDTGGRVTTVELLPTSRLPEPLIAPITAALQRNALFLPAIERGTAVAGQHDFTLRIPAADPKLAADTAWLNGEARVDLPIKSWLLLKPIKVPEQVFSTIDRVGEDGTVMLKAVTAGNSKKVSSSSQLNAFNSDWFDPAGPASVRPVAGAKQEVDGEKYTWKKATPEDGLVDFLSGAARGSYDFCVGYAWAEVESATDTEAWLGIGSDDGLKIWLNGELVNDSWVERTSRLDDVVVPLRLKQGKNHFLIKIQNVKGHWSFTCRLRVRGG
jgi:hypothetical protein